MNDPGRPSNEFLYSHRQYLVEAAERTQGDLDKTLVTLSSAALGITLVVLKDVVKPGNPIHGAGCLTWAWILLAACLAASLMSLAFSRRLTSAEISSVDRMIRCEDDPPDHQKRRKRWTTATTWANRFSLASFFFGTVLVLLFAHANL